MTFNAKRLSEINLYIKAKATGNPDEFAQKLGVSKSTLTRYISFMRKRKAPIRYDYIMCSYYYEEEGNFEIGFRNKESLYISNQNMIRNI